MDIIIFKKQLAWSDSDGNYWFECFADRGSNLVF